jgi:hypothetical protein
MCTVRTYFLVISCAIFEHGDQWPKMFEKCGVVSSLFRDVTAWLTYWNGSASRGAARQGKLSVLERPTVCVVGAIRQVNRAQCFEEVMLLVHAAPQLCKYWLSAQRHRIVASHFVKHSTFRIKLTEINELCKVGRVHIFRTINCFMEIDKVTFELRVGYRWAVGTTIKLTRHLLISIPST